MATHAEIAEALYSATPPTKTICHVYAVGGNSISRGTLQYNTTSGGYPGMTAAQKAKYWDVIHSNVWRLGQPNGVFATGGNNMLMTPVQKIHEFLYAAPETAVDAFSASMIIFPRLKELYSDSIHVAFCHVAIDGTGFRDIATNNWNINEPHPTYSSKNLTKKLADQLELTILHMEGMGYDVRVKGVLMIGQSVVDVVEFDAATYDKATFKTDFTAVVNYFRTTLGYTDVPFYVCETTQKAGYPAEAAEWNDAITELNASLGSIHLHYGTEWWNLPDSTHPDGVTGCNSWGEGAETNGHKNMAELIYSIENP